MRQTGEVVKRYAGDEDAAKQYLGIARVLLGRMKAYLAGAHGSKVWNLPDGTVIVTKSIPSGDLVEILVNRSAKEKRAHEHGIYFSLFPGALVPSSFLVAKDGTFVPFTRRDDVERTLSGTIQWKGRREEEMLWFRGPDSRYFIYSNVSLVATQLNTYLLTHENAVITGPAFGRICGAAMYREEDGKAIIVAHTNSTELRFSRLEANLSWTQIGTFSPGGPLRTVCLFSKRGNRATFVSLYGGLYEVNLTHSDIGVDVLEAPKIRTITADVGSWTFNTVTGTFPETEDLVSNIAVVELLTTNTPGMVDHVTAPLPSHFDVIVAADFNAEDEIVTAFKRYRNGGDRPAYVERVGADKFYTNDHDNPVTAGHLGDAYDSYKSAFTASYGHSLAESRFLAHGPSNTPHSYTATRATGGDSSFSFSQDDSHYPFVGGSVELLFSEGGDPIPVSEATSRSFTASGSASRDVVVFNPGEEDAYTETTSSESYSESGGMSGTDRNIRFLDINTRTAILCGNRLENTHSFSASGSYFSSSEGGGSSSGSGSATGTANTKRWRFDEVYQDGALAKFNEYQSADYTDNYSKTYLSPLPADDYITFNIAFPSGQSLAGDFTDDGTTGTLGTDIYSAGFSTFTATSTCLTLNKYNFMFSSTPYTKDLAGDGPLNVAHMDGVFRVPAAVTGFNLVHYNLTSK